MAGEISITASAIVGVSGYSYKRLLSASAMSQGQSVFENTSDQWQLCDADAASTMGTPYVTLNEVTAAGQPVDAIISGDLDMGAILTVNDLYVCSEVLGGIQPIASLASGDYLGILGVAITTSRLHVLPYYTAQPKA